MRVAVFGAGLVGTRAASMLVEHGHDVLLVAKSRQPSAQGDQRSAQGDQRSAQGDQRSAQGEEPGRGSLVRASGARGWNLVVTEDVDVVVLATEAAGQVERAELLLAQGTSVISTAADPQVVEELWALDSHARQHQARLLVGVVFSPGVSTLLVSALALRFDEVSAIRTAQFGTGGPACARQHHRSMGSSSREVNRGALRETRGGTGRELVWFPDPVGPADCYRAGLADPFLLHQAFPDVPRIESRQAATRRDRLTSRLPMLRPPHAEGLLGAVWAEVRGVIDGRIEHQAMAVSAPQATGAAALIAACCELEFADESPLGSPLGPSRNALFGSFSAASLENAVLYMRFISTKLSLLTYDSSRIVANSGVATPSRPARKWIGSGKNRINMPFSPTDHNA